MEQGQDIQLTDYVHHSENSGFIEYQGNYDEMMNPAADDPQLPPHEIKDLFEACVNARERNDETGWENIRTWLRQHSVQEAANAAKVSVGGDHGGSTPLHIICESSPPVDIVEVLLRCAPESLQVLGYNDRVPLHYACAKASDSVIMMLIKEFPEATHIQDADGRTPLHFALGRTESPVSPEVASLLISSPELPRVQDNGGYLPLHFACAYGAVEDVVYMLIEGNSETITAKTQNNRTPLHFLMGNCDRSSSHSILEILLKTNPKIVNSVDMSGKLPVDLLGIRARDIDPSNEEGRNNAKKCLSIYLNAQPEGKTEFFTALQSLPDWLRDTAVVMPVVQKIMNSTISQPFLTAILLMDMYFLVLIIAFFTWNVLDSIDIRSNDDFEDKSISFNRLITLYFGALYFLIREAFQIVSLVRLNLFDTWLFDSNNWLDLTFIFLVFIWTIVMNTGAVELDVFRIGTAVSLFIFYINFLSKLQIILVDFAVFVIGVLHVIRRLVSFLTALVIIILGFMQGFVTLFRSSGMCRNTELKEEDIHLFCSYGNSFIKLMTMLLGEVDDHIFKLDNMALTLFILFMFIAVILLANLLIAIVTDSYAVIRDERSAIVFWSSRLDFVTEMNAVSSNLKRWGLDWTGSDTHDASRNLWERLVELLFEEDFDSYEMSRSVTEVMCYVAMQLVAAIIIPLWVLLGFVTAGLLWPPQVREYLLQQRISSSGEVGAAGFEKSKIQVKAVNESIKEWKNSFLDELETDRQKMAEIKSQLTIMKADISQEMKEIKQTVEILFAENVA